MRDPEFLRWLAVIPSLWLTLSTTSATDLESIIWFNTTCAQCHEGECSGRLSFTSGAGAAFAHIRRYAGAVDDATAQSLYDALVRMKTTCAFAPMPAPNWRTPGLSAALDPYRNATTGAYFVPLGTLQPGQYRLALQVESPVALHLEVINDHFELLEETCVKRRGRSHEIQFLVEEADGTFLRLRSPENTRLQSLELEEVPR